MPQGKGTYGSQVGRPPKKKKYQKGGSVDPFSSKNPKGIVVEKALEAIEEQNAMPTTNAMDRSQTSPMGNEVGTGMYPMGGKVSKHKWLVDGKPVTLPEAKFPKQTLKGKEMKPVPLPKAKFPKQTLAGKEMTPVPLPKAKLSSSKKKKKGKK